jgi:hypothetical protein
MTIVIKAEEINRLIHRYLVEQGTVLHLRELGFMREI